GYSVFTSVMAPVAAAIGLGPAFLLVYLLSKALFFGALLRLTFALVPDRAAAVLALVYLAMAPLPLGGNEIFHLNEPFLTPRTPACGLVLLRRERGLARRPGQAALLLGGAFALHPLMAFGGGLALLLWGALAWLRPGALAALAALAGVAGAAVVFHEPLGTRLFGHLDEEWREVILELCFFIHPAAWTAGDWLRVVCCAGVTAAAAF